ncbi:hypothetical protein ACJIZ3_010946 [Penstemon smallii]|uniref:DUF674 family protein n=1 Tax=Penstemon smallii TaxID=265156 RepID=A0ABD3UHR1_9LAMI
MSGAEEVRFSMKVMINKEKTKVLLAVVDNNLADILLSFLTLPVGVILRLLKKQYEDEAPVIGSFNTLRNGLENLDSVHFSTVAAKLMLLNPRSSLDVECSKLKLNIDDTQPIKYFTCENMDCDWARPVNVYYEGIRRCYCKKLTNREIYVKYSSDNSQVPADGEVFTVKSVSFIVSDDLRILANVTGSIIQSLNNMGITDTDGAELRTVTVGYNEIMDLFKGSLLSNSPLTDLIIQERRIEKSEPLYSHLPDMEKVANSSSSRKMVVKAMLQKSTKKLLFVQSEEDFVDFLFSFLTIPLGQVECLLGGKTGLGSIDNLYRSVANMSGDKYFNTRDTKDMLLKPKLPPKFLSKNQIFSLTEEQKSQSFTKVKEKNMDYLSPSNSGMVAVYDPKGDGSYVKGPGLFMVTDDLTVTPLCILSSLLTLKELNIPLSDVEELELDIGLEEGLSILKASLTSTYALTNGLINPILMKQPKKEH